MTPTADQRRWWGNVGGIHGGQAGCCETEVANLDVHVLVKEDVAELEVTVDDLMSVHVMACANELDHVESGLGFREAFPPAEHIHERAVVAELECHVDVVFVFEAFLETNDVGMLQGLVNLNFCIELRGIQAEREVMKARNTLWFWPS